MKVLIIGNGQVGSALASIISKHHSLTVMDLEAKTAPRQKFDILHICFPYSNTFLTDVSYYIRKYTPDLTLIESTVQLGTTRKIHALTEAEICHSPVRGCHSSLLWGLTTYTKFVGPCSLKAGLLAERYYQGLGMRTYIAKSSNETELAKLANLSYYATQIAYFQELERKAKQHNIKREDIHAFFESTTRDSKGEVQRPILKGDYIGGSCVIPGLKLLFNPSKLYDWIEESNNKCQ